MAFHLKSMVFILPGVLEVFHGYTILHYGKFVQCLVYYGITQVIVCTETNCMGSFYRQQLLIGMSVYMDYDVVTHRIMGLTCTSERIAE